jgi:thioesterase domain-containing protein
VNGYLRDTTRAMMQRIGKAVPLTTTAVAQRWLQETIESRKDLGDDPLVRTVIAILDAEKDYVPAERIYPGKITFFYARDAESDFEDNRFGWRRSAAGGFEVHIVPGDHTTMREEPHVAVLAKKLKPWLK